MELENISMHEAYKKFCSKHPLKKLSMPKSDLVWCYYDINSRSDNIIIFLHGICGTAGCYFYQMDVLANLGLRVISFQYPCYNYLKDWIKNMCNILEYLNIKKAHFFASDLGGYLIQLYSKLYPSKIESLILCNSYRKTDDFAAIAPLRNIYGKLYCFLPHVLLKKIILENYIYSNYVNIDLKEKNSLEFMSNEIDLISAADIGGRISLQFSSETIDKIYVNDKFITIIQTLNNMYSDSLNEDMKKAYPFSKHAIMKSGGDFPYLSRHEEVNMYILVHLRNNCKTAFVKEQINNMSYIQEKNKDNYEQVSIKEERDTPNYWENVNNYNICYDTYNNNNNINKNSNNDKYGSEFHKKNTNDYYTKHSLYKEQNGNYSNRNNYITNSYIISKNSNALNINHNDNNYMNNIDSYENIIDGIDKYDFINKEYSYIDTSNDSSNRNNKNINNSEESYNKESLNYQDDFNQNNSRNNHTNQSDIFCHF